MAQKEPTHSMSEEDSEPIRDRPAQSLLRSWGKRMSQGNVAAIPVFIGGKWSIAVPRGNKRVLQFAINPKVSKVN